MGDAGPTRTSADLADVVELLLDKGLVVNADIAVSIGDTQLLGIQIRAAVASFETAAKYGLEFPEGTDQQRIDEVASRGRLGSSNEEVASESKGLPTMNRPKGTPISEPTTDDPSVESETNAEEARASSQGESASADANEPRRSSEEAPDAGDFPPPLRTFDPPEEDEEEKEAVAAESTTEGDDDQD